MSILPSLGESVVGLLRASPWIAIPLIATWRARHSRSLDDVSPAAPVDAPTVSVIVPARNEARNMDRCLRSALASTYPALEVIVVDDHSTDDTGEIARAIAASDSRVRVVAAEPLPDGWFGKQWACASGARASTGEVLCFTDADTFHAPDLVSRAVVAMREREADMLSVVGRQELGGVWERIVQPHIFSILAMRYGGTEDVNRSRHAYDKIANGQCIFITRAAYDDIGGHAAVRSYVAEDLMLAQRAFSMGKRTVLILGIDQLSTRMYTSLRELVRGWRKNVFAGGRESVPFGRLGRLLFPLLLLTAPLMGLMPPLVLAAAIVGAISPVPLWAVLAYVGLLVWWIAIYRRIGLSLLYAFIAPVGSLILLGICVQAIARGSNVAWKDRDYVAG